MNILEGFEEFDDYKFKLSMLEEIEYKRENVYADETKTYDGDRMLPMMCKYKAMAKISKKQKFLGMKLRGGQCRQFKAVSVDHQGQISDQVSNFAAT